MAGVEADVGVEAALQGDGGLGTAFFDALDVVVGHRGPQAQLGDGQPEDGADVVKRLTEGPGLADRDPLGGAGDVLGAGPAGGSRPSSRRQALPHHPHLLRRHPRPSHQHQPLNRSGAATAL
jgi:hypothetical protein